MKRPITSISGMDGSPTVEALFIYRIDAEDRLIFVTSAWLDFARENEAVYISKEIVQGESLCAFIADPETQHLYQIIINKVRETQESVILPFLCDSPDLRRFMELHISPLPDGALQFKGKLVREEPREHVTLLDSSIKRDEDLITSCSW